MAENKTLVLTPSEAAALRTLFELWAADAHVHLALDSWVKVGEAIGVGSRAREIAKIRRDADE